MKKTEKIDHFVKQVWIMTSSIHTYYHPPSPCRAGLPVSNDETDSNKSGSSHSDPYHHTTLLYPHQHQGKGKQLPKGMHLNTIELLDLANDEDSANSRRLDR